MAKRLLKTMILPLTVMATALAFIACDGNNPPDVKYKVTYEIGAGATGTAPTETDKAVGEKFIIKSADGITYEGYNFAGWSDGSLIYTEGAEYTMPSKAVTFTAYWKSADETMMYTVTYKLGAAGEDVVRTNQPAANYTVEAPTVYEDTGDDEYYKLFAGWTVEGDDTVYLPGGKLTLTDDTVFIAQWEEFDDDDNVWTDTTGELRLFLLTDKVGAFAYQNLDGDYVWNYFAYTVTGTAITVTPTKGNPATGTLEDGELTISVTVGMATYQFEPEQEQPTGKPTVTFNANGGTGTAPVIDDADIVATTNNQYNIVLPQCTYTAPANKEFDKWEVISGNKSLGNYAAGSTFKANEGENLTLKAVWKDTQAPAGVVLYGNCTLPSKSFMGQTQGGETVVQIVIDTTDTQNVKIKYMLAGDVAYSNDKTADGEADAQWMPDVYGDDALYCGAFQIGAFKYNVVVKSDLTALYLCNTNDELLDNGEFTTTPPAPATYTVTYANPNGATGNLPEAVTVDEGTQVTLAADTQFTKEGYEFQGWKVNGSSTLREANDEIEITANTTIIPVFGIVYTDSYNNPWIVRDDGYVDDGYGEFAYTLEGNTITMPDNGGFEEGRIDNTNKTIVFKDAYAGLTATAANGATLELDGFGGATLGANVGTYTEGGSLFEPVLIITFGTVVVNDVEVLWDDYGYTAIGLNINATITIDGTDYVFGSQDVEPITIPQQFVGTFNGMSGTTAYVVKITMDSVTVTVGAAAPVVAEITDYDQISKMIAFNLGQDEWYIRKASGFDDDVDSIEMDDDFRFRSSITLGRPTNAITIDPEYCGTFVGGGYTVIVTKYAVIVKNGDAAAIVAELEDYDEDYSMISMTLNGEGYSLMLDETGLYLMSDDQSVDVTLTPDNGSEDEGNGVPAKFYGYYSDAGFDYSVYITDTTVAIFLPSWDEEKGATSVEYYDYGAWGEGIKVTVDGVDYDIQLDSEAGGQVTSLKLYIDGAETPLATVTPVEW
ncbi:MAG: InlB B-repeat-containing protein [Clostridiales bacterium]|nr:InlB B-repeat-containing protein [Clostridiales bacterium]